MVENARVKRRPAIVAAGLAAALAWPTTLAAVPPTRAPTTARPARKLQFRHLRHIVLDPGHGGENKGAVGHLGTREKVLTLELAQRFRAHLLAQTDLKVTLTRDEDRDLALRERPRMANQLQGDVLVSVHCNSSPDETIRGMEVWFLAADSSLEAGLAVVRREEGIEEDAPAPARRVGADAIVHAMRMAEAHERSELFAHDLAAGLRRARTGMRFRGVRQARFGVLKEAEMPAVVFEVGYISHPEEGRHLLEVRTQEALAQGLLSGLVALERQLAERAAAGGPPSTNAGGPNQPAAPRPTPTKPAASSTAATSASARRSSAPPPSPPSSRTRATPSGPRSAPQRRPTP